MGRLPNSVKTHKKSEKYMSYQRSYFGFYIFFLMMSMLHLEKETEQRIFVIDLQVANRKTNKKKVFLLITVEGIFTSFFKDKNTKRSHKTIGIKGFLNIFAL